MQRVDGGTPRRCRRGARRLRRGARRLRRCLQNLRRRLQKKRRGGIHATTTSARAVEIRFRETPASSRRVRDTRAPTPPRRSRASRVSPTGTRTSRSSSGISTGRLRRGRAGIRDSGRRVSERGAHRGVRDAPTTARLREPRVLRVEPRVSSRTARPFGVFRVEPPFGSPPGRRRVLRARRDLGERLERAKRVERGHVALGSRTVARGR